MSTSSIAVFLATRPDIIKLTPVVKELDRQQVDYTLVHAGQHYDANMSANFFEELKIKTPDKFLEAAPDAASQVSDLIPRISDYIRKNPMKAAVVLGDTNSAMTAAVSACVSFIPVAHVEAGCRSFDRRMPEEINRVLIADCAELHFAPTKDCMRNLLGENVPGVVIFSGHPVVELVHELGPKIESRSKKLNFPFALMTLHRPENSDDKEKLAFILKSMGGIDMPIIFTVHPRTRKNLKKFGLEDRIPKNIRLAEPMTYIEMLSHIRSARFVATDSGGVQQEAFLLKTPCVTIRRSLDWPETLEAGVNFLANPELPGFEESITAISQSADAIRLRFKNTYNIFGNGTASKTIVEKLKVTYGI